MGHMVFGIRSGRESCCWWLVPLLAYWLYPPEIKDGEQDTEMGGAVNWSRSAA